MKKYNVLICGAGGQGALSDAPGSPNENKYISFAHAFCDHEGFELCGFYDKDGEKSVKAIEAWAGAAYCCINHAIEFDRIDIAVVATPDNSHYDILKQLAKHPLKLVICEKPLCTDLQQAREIVKLYKGKGIPLMVDYTRRFIPELQELKQRYETGEFGKIQEITCAFNRGFIHTGSHLIDFIRWFFNGDLLHLKEAQNQGYRIWQIQLFFEKYFWQEQRIGDMPVPSYYDKHMWYVAENAYNFLEGKEPLLCTAEDALKALEICFELMEG